MGDLLDIVEAAYADVADDRAWISRILAAAAPHLAHDWGAAICLADTDFNLSDYATLGLPAGPDPYLEGHRLTGADVEAKLVSGAKGKGALVSAVELLGQPSAKHDPIHLRKVALPRGAGDVVMLLVDSIQDEYLTVSALHRKPWLPKRGEREAWNRVASHVGAGLRLRRNRAAEASAVVTPNGDVEHAQPEAQQATTLAALAEAVRRSEKARGSLRRAEPQHALHLWQGLVSGRWSLVDHFDSDGRRYILARENAPNPSGSQQLSARQRSIVRLRVGGQSLNHIAYQLGLSVGTISVELKQALRLLGVKSMNELAAILSTSKEPVAHTQ